MRNNLYDFRVARRMTQESMAETIGVKRARYAAIENGTRDGRQDFWIAFQRAFDVKDAEMWRLILND